MMKIEVNSCSESLKACALAYPCHFDITVPINEKQRRNKGKVNKELALRQHSRFVNLLQGLGVKTYFLEPVPDCNYQVFTRDVGFVIGNVLFLGKMRKKIREKEVSALKRFSSEQEAEGKLYQLENNAEGGDVFVLKDFVLIGVSSRTSESAVSEIKNVLAKTGVEKEVIVLRFDVSKLHLDCVLGVLNEETAVITPFLQEESVKVLKSLFKTLIEIDEDAAEALGTNFVPIDGKRVITTNLKVKEVLEECGFQPLYTDYSEFIKAGGSVRCSVLPLTRA